MTTSTLVWIVVVVVLVAALVAVLVAMRKRQQTHRQHEAARLREEATAAAPGIRESERHAREAEARAERARLEAQRAEREAQQARRGADMEHAHVEDRVREADRLDPSVDHRATDYAPDTSRVEPTEATGPTHRGAPATDDPAHEGEGGRHSV